VRQIVKAWDAQRKIVKMACPCSATYLCFVLADTLGSLGRRFFFSLSLQVRQFVGVWQAQRKHVKMACPCPTIGFSCVCV